MTMNEIVVMIEKILSVPTRMLNTRSPNLTIPLFSSTLGNGIVSSSSLQKRDQRKNSLATAPVEDQHT